LTRLIICVDEGLALSERRSIVVWEAVTELACDLLPQKSSLLRRWSRKHVASRDEAAAWLEACIRIRDYRPTPTFDPSGFYTPLGYDLEKASAFLGVKPRVAAKILRKLEKALMLYVSNEVAAAVRHSCDARHKIVLR